MEILYFKSLPSTQLHLIKLIELAMLEDECVVYTDIQTHGVGSRDNRWDYSKGNLFVSFALKQSSMPTDLPLSSASIYFGFLIKQLLKEYCNDVWLKWPNDIYKNDKKIGGLITQKKDNFFILGLGLNLISNSRYLGLDVKIDKKTLIQMLVQSFKNGETWKEIFSKYRLEFDKSKEFETSVGEDKISLQNAKLLDDGSIQVEGKRIFNLR